MAGVSMKRNAMVRVPLFSLCWVGCSRKTADVAESAAPQQPNTFQHFAPLLSRIWRVSDSAYGSAAGSIYIFLPKGTLRETSCVETYRIATWSVDKPQLDTLRVVEDQQPVFTATLGESSGSTLLLHQKAAARL
jgi:hypothetical protein